MTLELEYFTLIYCRLQYLKNGDGILCWILVIVGLVWFEYAEEDQFDGGNVGIDSEDFACFCPKTSFYQSGIVLIKMGI